MFYPDLNTAKPAVPANLKELHTLYATNDDCLPWATGLHKCPHCEGKLWWRPKKLVWRCQDCSRDISLSNGTALGQLHLAAPTMFDVAWRFAESTVSARNLALVLGVSRTTSHKLLKVFRDEITHWVEQQILSGDVEVDETFLDWNKKKGRASRPAVLLLAERTGKKRIVAVEMRDTKQTTCERLVQKFVKPGSFVYTDAWRGYQCLTNLGYHHKPVNVSASGRQAHVDLPAVHSAANQLKTSMRTFSRHPADKYFPLYLAEWSWRYSNRKKSTGERWARLVQMINERRER